LFVFLIRLLSRNKLIYRCIQLNNDIYICITLPKLDSIKNIPSNYRAHLLAPARLRNCTCCARQLHAPRTGRLRVPCKTRRRGGQGSTKKWSTKLGSPWRRNNNGFSRTGTDRPIPAPPRTRIPRRTVPAGSSSPEQGPPSGTYRWPAPRPQPAGTRCRRATSSLPSAAGRPQPAPLESPAVEEGSTASRRAWPRILLSPAVGKSMVFDLPVATLSPGTAAAPRSWALVGARRDWWRWTTTTRGRSA